MRLKTCLLSSLVAIGLFASPVLGQGQPDEPTPPRLVVAISVDQLSSELFAEYRSHYRGGLARLAQQGAVFPSGYQSHAATETCPGHSTILTGSRPARTGIIANYYFDLDAARDDKFIYCAEDENLPGTASDNYIVSPVHLRVPTLGDRLKAAHPAVRVVSVAGKDRAAVMMGGHHADETWWWDGTGFVSYRGRAEHALVTRENRRIAAELAQPVADLAIPDHCIARQGAVTLPAGWNVGEHRFSRAAEDRGAYRASPALDRAVLQLAKAFVASEELGRGPQTDVLAVGLSATDYVGHRFGTQGLEMCLQMDLLDRQLGEFFSVLDATGIDYLVVLTADHGGTDLPERAAARANTEAARVDPALDPVAFDHSLREALRLDHQLIYADAAFGDYYVARDLTDADRARVIALASARLAERPQVAAVFTRAALAQVPMPIGQPDLWSLEQRARANFDEGRSGDLIVLGKPWISPIIDPVEGANVTTHGSPWSYDQRVPIIFWRNHDAAFEQTLPVETVDILPTLATLIGLDIPASEIDGRCLDLDPGPPDTCSP